MIVGSCPENFNGPVNGDDLAVAVGVNCISGNVYVTGSSLGGFANFDYATVKYDMHGNQVWIRRFDGP